jgi:hypothetical protein
MSERTSSGRGGEVESVRRLSGQDAVFVYAETPSMPMHTIGTMILDPSDVPGGRFGYGEILATLEARIHLVPPFRQRLLEIPLGLGHPMLVDDPEFRVANHVHRLAVPAPGTLRELAEIVGDIAGDPAVGDVGGRRTAGGADRAGHQAPPLHDRRRLGREPDGPSHGPRGRGEARAAARALGSGAAALAAGADAWVAYEPPGEPDSPRRAGAADGPGALEPPKCAARDAAAGQRGAPALRWRSAGDALQPRPQPPPRRRLRRRLALGRKAHQERLRRHRERRGARGLCALGAPLPRGPRRPARQAALLSGPGLDEV